MYINIYIGISDYIRIYICIYIYIILKGAQNNHGIERVTKNTSNFQHPKEVHRPAPKLGPDPGGLPHSWMVYNGFFDGKFRLEMDDNWG